MTGTSLAVVGGMSAEQGRLVTSGRAGFVDPSRSTPGLPVTGLIARDGALRPLEGLASGSLTLAGAQARLAGLDLAAHLRALDRLGIPRSDPRRRGGPSGWTTCPRHRTVSYVGAHSTSRPCTRQPGGRGCPRVHPVWQSGRARNMAAAPHRPWPGGHFRRRLRDRRRRSRGALSAGGPTVAVLWPAASTFYPQANAGLFRRILDDGALVSELPPGCAPYRQRFLARNRLIAALGVRDRGGRGKPAIRARSSTAGQAFETLTDMSPMVPGP